MFEKNLIIINIPLLNHYYLLIVSKDKKKGNQFDYWMN